MENDAYYYKYLTDNYVGTMLVMDNRHIIRFVNQSLLHYFNLEKEDIVGKTMEEMIQRGIFSSSSSLQALNSGETVYQYTIHAGRKPIMAISVPVRDSSGEIETVCTYTMYEDYINALETQAQHTLEINTQLVDLFITNKHGDIDQTIIANSPKMRKALSVALRVASTNTPSIIYGESGTGKEIIAHYIFEHSLRSKEVFLPVNCAAIPESLMESEFFGYEKGAFTGANSNGKMGYFELANHGTIFLDEVEDMPLSMQSKLLRVLESGEIMRIGGKKPKHVDVRLISASNKNLFDLANEGKFRWDLFYRMNVVPIFLPPLRERGQDIDLLANYFLTIHNKKHGRNCVISKELLDAMREYSWPGNIREMRNLLERYVITSSNDVLYPLKVYDLDAAISGAPPDEDIPSQGLVSYGTNLNLKSASRLFEKNYIQNIIGKCDGNIAKAAKQLGISRSTLYYKLQ